MKILIPKPCHENWDLMTPDQQGKFCQVCSKTVHDFSQLPDDKLMECLNNNPNICANVKPDKLDRNFMYSHLNSLFSKFAVGFILTSAGLIPVNAQQTTSKSDSTILKQTKGKVLVVQNNKKDSINSKMMLRGEISTAHENDPPMYILNGKIVDEKTFKQVDQKSIEKLNVLKGSQATALYGVKARNGAIVISTKKK